MSCTSISREKETAITTHIFIYRDIERERRGFVVAVVCCRKEENGSKGEESKGGGVGVGGGHRPYMKRT